MCGIIGVLSRRPTRPAPTHAEVVTKLDEALGLLGDPVAVTAAVAAADALLKGLPGVIALADRRELVHAMIARLDQLDAFADDLDRRLEIDDLPADLLEQRGAEAIALRDALWAVRRDRLRTAHEVSELAGRDASVGALSAYLSIQQAFSALDRLEVRGRDSAGIHVFVHDHGLDLGDPSVQALIRERSQDPTFQSESVRVVGEVLSFVYKAAAEIGELGDNTRALRAPPCATISCCGERSPHPTHAPPCSDTPGGPASASSPSPMPTRSTATSSSRPAARRISWRRSTATSTITPISASSISSASTTTSPPTPR